MNLLFSMGIVRRLWAVTILLSLGLGGLAALAYVRLSAVEDAARAAEHQRVPQLAAASAMELNITRVSLQLRHAILSRTAGELQATLDDITTKRRLISESMAAYDKALVGEDGQKGRQMFQKLAPLMAEFWRHGEANLALVQAGRKEEAFAYLVDKTIPARNATFPVIAELVAFQRASLGADIEQLARHVHGTLTALEVLVGISVLSLVLSSASVAKTLRRRLGLSNRVVAQVRDGDLATPVVDTSKDEFSPLLQGLREMQLALREIVTHVRGNAEGVATASAQIAMGNLDLSGRTEQQASALQQTAATMEQLGTTVRHNADNARQAKQLASSASGVAVQGGEVVGQVIRTMQGINEASQRIADIIGTIDGIAFQTNILALNAAVEAARAGEQGRGFAVVAGEVRNLAQRSAEAAREIKTLIGSNMERVEQGSSLVDQAGRTMGEIEAAIHRVSDIVAEISSASQEQSNGVGQVGQAVTQMDQATQQNAALVEESAAAAESLRGQSARLVEAVAVFRLAA